MAYFDCIVGGSGKGNTLVVTCVDELAGATITCTNGTKTYTKTCPSTAPYEVTFYGLMAGTWTVSATVSGNTYTTTVVVADIEALLGGFNWRTWVDTAQYLDSSDYNSLDEVLADELAVRELCLEHACVDYLVDIATANEDVETIINNDLFAKWVNNSDYSLDVLGANVAIKALMDTADKYGYGEWVITDDSTTPPTWGPKGNVPIMTANNAPYGEASASSTYSGMDAYKAFDGNANDRWSANTNAGTSARITYKFTNPVCVKEVSGLFGVPSGTADITFKIQASNTGIAGDFVDLDDGFHHIGQQRVTTKLDNDNYYLYYSILCTNNANTGYMSVGNLQFYGRELKVSVPTMTGNTTPYGEASASSEHSSPYAAWHAFNGDAITVQGWTSTQTTNAWIAYDFGKKVKVKMINIAPALAGNPQGVMQLGVKNFILQGSNDGISYDDIYTGIIPEATAVKNNYYTIEDDNAYKYLRLYVVDSYRTGGGCNIIVNELQFYCEDYSEKEFEAGTTKKWLYDHGVELETISLTAMAVKENDMLVMTQNSVGSASAYVPSINLTVFSLVRAKTGNKLIAYSNEFGTVAVLPNNSVPSESIVRNAISSIVPNNVPYHPSLDISSFNELKEVVVEYNSSTARGAVLSITEWWLE